MLVTPFQWRLQVCLPLSALWVINRLCFHHRNPILQSRLPWLSFSAAAAPGRKSGGFWSEPQDEPRQQPIVASPLLQPMCAVNGYGFLPSICLSGCLLVSWRPDSLGRTVSPRWLIQWRSGSSSLPLLVGFTLCFMSLGLNLCFLLPLTLPATDPPPHPLVLWMALLPIWLGDYSTSCAAAEGFSISWTGRIINCSDYFLFNKASACTRI